MSDENRVLGTINYSKHALCVSNQTLKLSFENDFIQTWYPYTGHNSFRFETPHLLVSFILRPPANLIKHRAVEGTFALKFPIISFES